LGLNATMPWHLDSVHGTTITLPESLQQAGNRPCDYAWTLKFEMMET